MPRSPDSGITRKGVGRLMSDIVTSQETIESYRGFDETAGPAGLPRGVRQHESHHAAAVPLYRNSESDLVSIVDWMEWALRASGHTVWECRLTENYYRSTDSFAQMLGYAPDELPAELDQVIGMIHPADRGPLMTKAWEHWEGAGNQESFETEYRFLGKDGRWHWFLSRGKIVARHADGRAKTAMGTTICIDPWKAAERTLRLCRDSMERSRDMMLWLRPDGSITDANESACRSLGYTREEIQERMVADFLVRRDAVAWDSIWQDLDRRGQDTFESYCQSRGGDLIPVHAYVELIRGNDECAAFMTLHNLTQQRKTEEHWRRSEAILTSAQRIAHLGVIRWDRNGQGLEISEEFLHILGIKHPHVPLRLSTIVRHVHVDEQKSFRRRLAAALQESDRFCFDERIVQASGELRYIHGEIHFERDGGGVVRRLLGFVQDVSDRENAQRTLQQHQQTLAHSTRIHTMGEMVAGIAHEITQPLGAITNYASACRRIVEAPAHDQQGWQRMHQWIGAIAGEAFRMGQIIDRLRSYVRGTEPHRSTHELFDVIRSAIDLTRCEARDRQVDVCIEYPEASCTVIVDAVQLQQVLVNILRNAFDATAELPSPTVELASTQADGSVTLTVTDNGCGIVADPIDSIFEPFVTSKPSGMGMGLSIARTIVLQHGGQIWATRNITSGLTFHIRLPLAGGIKTTC